MPKLKPFAVYHPDLLREWDNKQNVGVDPAVIGSSSRTKVWWIGNCGHKWQSELVSRVKGKGCPACAGKSVVSGFNDLATLEPRLAKEWHKSKNHGVSPAEVTRKSGLRVWWTCEFGHEFEAKIGERVRGLETRPDTNGCPVCINRKLVSGSNDLLTANPKLAEEFHPARNHPLTPNRIKASESRMLWWLCDKGHEFEQRLTNRVNANQGCPFCKNKSVAVGETDLATTNPELVNEWDFDANGELRPSDLVAGTNRFIWWKCKEGHRWKARGAKRLSGQGCPTCTNRILKTGFNDLLTKHPEIAATWDLKKNSPMKPEQVLYGTHEKFWWVCDLGHSWQTSPTTRTRTNCPRCANSGFDQSQPGIFYLIENKMYLSRKVGIANTKSDRIETWKKNGWRILLTHESDNGLLILNLETEILRWLRKDLKLPQHLGQAEMGRFGGGSETFSMEGVSKERVIKKIREIVSNQELESRK